MFLKQYGREKIKMLDTENSKIISKIILPKFYFQNFISKTISSSNFDCLLIQFFDW